MATVVNKGKLFEQLFAENAKKAFDKQVYCKREKDTISAYEHTQNSVFTQNNVCDYFLFYKGILYALELKSTKYPSMGFEADENASQKMIKYAQIKNLQKLTRYAGIVPGFVLNYRDEEKDDEHTYFFHIKDFTKFMEETDKKNITPGDVVLYGGIPIKTEKKRVYFSYDVEQMITDINVQILKKKRKVK